MPVNFDDPSTQRILSPEGETQARELGQRLTTLKRGSVAEGDCLVVRPGEPVGDVLAQLKPAGWKAP